MTEGPWRRFCVVGLGNHATTKLIPAILANGQELVGVVSRRRQGPPGVPSFTDIGQALGALLEDTAFVIASPPVVHFEQVIKVLEAGRDAIVEKPAFVTSEEARRAVGAAEKGGGLLVEGFMNRHTIAHRLFIDEWSRAKPASAEWIFTIPAVPNGTFRSAQDIGSSNLYDIASYVLAALVDVGGGLDEIHIKGVDHAGVPHRERVHMVGKVDGVRFSSVTGVADVYENSLRLVGSDGASCFISPFFYGRPGPRRVTRGVGDEAVESVIEDVNAFEAMLAVPLSDWRKDTESRGRKTILLAQHLERLGQSLSKFRGAAR